MSQGDNLAVEVIEAVLRDAGLMTEKTLDDREVRCDRTMDRRMINTTSEKSGCNGYLFFRN